MITLEKLKQWLALFPGMDILNNFAVDYTDQIPSNGGVFPSGMTEISRKYDVLGNCTVTKQHNFGIYIVFAKPPTDTELSLINQSWIAEFQEWVTEQSILGLAPIFGDVPHKEKITAQNGALYDATPEGLGTYMVQISVQFVEFYEV